MWLLYAFSYRKACDIRETKFSRRPVEDDHPDSSLIWSSPFLTSLLPKLASGVFSHQTWVLLRWTKTELNRNLSTCAENQSLLQSLQTAALLARCKFCFQWTKKMELKRKSMNDKNHETCTQDHRDRRKWSVISTGLSDAFYKH